MGPMRRLLVTLVPMVLLACSKEEPPDAREAAIKVEVSVNFKAGCIKVQAVDTENPENTASAEAQVWEPEKRVVTIAVFRKDNWGRTLNIITTAHERSCAGLQVAKDNRQITLDRAGVRNLTLALSATDEDGDGYIPTAGGGTDCDDVSAATNSEAREVCDKRDNNCQGGADEGLSQTEYFRDVDGDGAGAGTGLLDCAAPAGYAPAAGDCDDNDPDRTPGKTEVCDNKDNNCVGGVDEGFDKNWYPDGDGDGFGRNTNATVRCDQPNGFVNVTGGRFDCDDAVREVNPDAQETCNNRDDNCAGGTDEPFTTGPQAKGAACSAGSCNGTYRCNAAGSATECSATPPVDYYPDVDGDQQGNASASAARVCAPNSPPANHVAGNNADCDDADPGTRQAGTEVCDALDNDCDGQVDEGLGCGGTLRRVFDDALGDTGNDYRTVAVDPTDGYPVWIAGMNGVLVVRRTPGASFQSFDPAASGQCGTVDWYAAWARPGTESVFLAGENGELAEHNGTNCVRKVTAPNMSGGAYLTGLIGFTSPTLVLYTMSSNGGFYEWVPGSAPVRLRDSNDRYWDMGAFDASRILVVGDNNANPRLPRVFPYVPPYTGAPANQTLETPTNYSGSLRGVSMASASLAYAVGDAGLALRWTGGANWTRVVPPGSAASAPFCSVATLGGGSSTAYVVDQGTNGKLYRLTQFGFAVAPSFINNLGQPDNPDRALYDIAMTSVGNVWMVGDDGRVYHYPE